MPTYNFIVGTMVALLWMGGAFHHSAVTADHHGVTLSQGTILSDYIWEGALDLLPKAWDTTFIAGVVKGNMNPNFYGIYILQDAIYCRIVAELWTQLANDASADQRVREYANGSISGFQDCSTELFKQWNVKDDGGKDYGVIIKEPVMEYVTFIENAMVAHAPNMLIATYACLKLWHNLTSELWPMVANTTNPYAVWVDDNRGSGSSMRRQAAQMDEWDTNYHWYDWTEALRLFRSAMMNEINFFQNGGNSSTSSALLRTAPHSKRLLLEGKSNNESPIHLEF